MIMMKNKMSITLFYWFLFHLSLPYFLIKYFYMYINICGAEDIETTVLNTFIIGTAGRHFPKWLPWLLTCQSAVAQYLDFF